MIRTVVKCNPIQISRLLLRCHSTLDSGQIEHFTKLSEQWWDPKGQMSNLLAMNAIRVPFMTKGLIEDGVVKMDAKDSSTPLKGLKILDVGCGGGFLSEALAHLGAETTGLDATKDLIEVAKIHKAKDNSLSDRLNYVYSTIEDFAPTHQGVFDAVVSSEVIEHVAAPSVFAENCVKCVKPGGSVFITTISQTMTAYIAAILLAENVLNIIPKGSHEYEKLIRPETLRKLLENNNCTTKEDIGMWFNPWSKQWHAVRNTDIHYGLHAVKNK